MALVPGADALEMMRWTGRSILRAALTDGGPPTPPSSPISDDGC